MTDPFRPLLDAHLRLVLSAALLGTAACETRTLSRQVPAGTSCPPPREARADLPDRTCEAPQQRVLAVRELVGSELGSCWDTGAPDTDVACCTYEVLTVPEPGTGCVVGRPLLVDGRPAVAPVHAAESPWSRGPAPRVAHLSAEARRALADAWLRTARLEHASIASFAVFSLDLMAHGAPPHLLAGAHAAADDEVRHAADAFALASAYAGRALGPGPLGARREAAPTLTALVDALVREGCVGETIATCVAAAQRAVAEDPAVIAVLDAVVADEADHAALAWSALRWALAVGGPEVRDAARAAFDEATAAAVSGPLALGDVPPGARAHGLLDDAAALRAASDAVQRVITPSVNALLG